MSAPTEHDQPTPPPCPAGRLTRLRQHRWTPFWALPLFCFLTALWAQIAAVNSAEGLVLWFSDCLIIVLNIALMGVFVLFFYALTNRLRLACAVTFIMAFGLSVAHWMKLAVRGVALFPWDLALVPETAHVMDWGCLRGYWPNALGLLALAPAVVAAWLVLPTRRRARPWFRLAAAVLCTAFFASLFSRTYCFYRPLHDRILQLTWNQNRSYARAGVLLAFTAEIQNYFVPCPEDYTREAVMGVYDALGPEDDPPPDAPGPDRPVNLILILGEAFWDPTALPGVTFGSDPIEAIRRQCRRIDLVSPVYGGGTCNAELEVLSGCNMAFFPPGAAPYSCYIRRPLPSLASVLRKRGYFTAAVHAVEVSYFNDCEVQPRLGFERYHPATEWEHVEKASYYITDAAAFREAVRITDQLDKPFFISVNTMETHWPFPADRYYDRAEVADLKAPALTAKARTILETFVCGVRRTDYALAELIARFRDDPRPTMIVLYGDHLPALGEDYRVFRESGFWSEKTADPLRMRTVPALFWSNFPMKLPDRQTMSMCYVPPLILRAMRVPLPPFFRFLEACKRRYPVLSVSGCVDAAGRHVPLADVLRTDIAHDYRLLQYDRVFGEQYFRALAGPPPPADPQNPFDD